MRAPLYFSLALLLFASCADKEFVTADGFWRQLGYGKIFEIHGDSVKIYDLCSMDCSEFAHLPLAEKGRIERFSADSLLIRKNIKTYRFVRLDALPDLCLNPIQNQLSPKHNFEVLWNTINENYCYFKQRDIDWEAVYKKYEPQITNKTSQAELFILLDEMLSGMNDGHVSIMAPESLLKALEALQSSKDDRPTEEQVTQLIDQFALANMLADRYCSSYKTYNAGILNWGFINADIAYLQVNAMIIMANYNMPSDLSIEKFVPQYFEIASKQTFQRQDEIDGAKLMMDSIFTEFQNAKALILDLRFNQGGKDEVGLEVIGHLTAEDYKFASKKTRLKDGFTNHQDLFVERRAPYYGKKVYALTSCKSASAAEAALMATLPLDHVFRIGGNSEGIFSDGLDRKLPNGWEYVLSNEIYSDLEGNSYEGIGIPPQMDLGYPRNSKEFINTVFKQLENGGDLAIEKTLALERD